MPNIKKIIEYGLYLIVFLLPIQTRLFLRFGDLNEYSEYTAISLYGIDILLLIILLLNCFIAFKSIKSEEKRIPTIWLILAGLELAIFISIFVSTDKWLAVYRYGVFLLGVGLFWLVISASYNKFKLLWSLILGLALQAGLGIWQFMSQASFSSKWLGIASHESSALGASVIETLDGQRWLRAYGGLDHPNVLGGALAIGLLIIIFLLCHPERSEGSRDLKDKQDSSLALRMTKITFYFLFFTSLLFSFSRAAWLAFAIGICTILLFYIKRKYYEKQKVLLKLIVLSAVFIFVFNNFYPNIFQTRLTGEARLEVKSNQERIVSYSEAKDVIKDNIFFGAGIGNYILELKNKYPDQKSFSYQPVHNTYLLILSEIGIFGFLFFIFILLYLIKQNLRQKNSIGVAIIISIVIMMMFDHWWWSLHFGVLFFWLIIGLLYNKKEKEV